MRNKKREHRLASPTTGAVIQICTDCLIKGRTAGIKKLHKKEILARRLERGPEEGSGGNWLVLSKESKPASRPMPGTSGPTQNQRSIRAADYSSKECRFCIPNRRKKKKKPALIRIEECRSQHLSEKERCWGFGGTKKTISKPRGENQKIADGIPPSGVPEEKKEERGGSQKTERTPTKKTGVRNTSR